MANKRGVSGEVWPVWHAFAARFRWVAGVPGNHDVLEDSAEKMRGNLHLLDDDQAVLDGLNIAGLGGIIGNSRKPHRRAEEVFGAAVRRLVAGRPDVLVLHESPDLREERLRGNRIVREALGEGADTLVVCGHCHWPCPLATLPGGMRVLNVDGRCVVLRPR